MSRPRPQDQGPNKQILRRTLVLMGLCGVLAFVVLAVQLFYIQIINHSDFERRAIQQHVREVAVTAGRGTIYDATGAVWAMSATVHNVFVSPAELIRFGEDKDFVARGLAEILEVEEEMIRERMENTRSYYEVIARQIEYDLEYEVRAFVRDNGLRSVHLEPTSRRYFPLERTGSHIVGFVAGDGSGMGVEGSYDCCLSGVDGRIVRLRGGGGVDMLRASYENYYRSEPGHDIHLTIDTNVQRIMERHMNQAVHNFDLRYGGIAFAMNPQTGAVLGMVSLEDFNPNSPGRLSEERMEALRARFPENEEALQAAVNEELFRSFRNKNIGYTYEPGSTFKALTFAIALEEGLVTVDDGRVFYCGGQKDVRGRVDPVNCWRRTGHGALTFTQAFQQSCNIATVELALQIGPELFLEYMRGFGLFETTGIDLNGEAMGQWWSEADWIDWAANGNFSSLAAASFGQTFTLTPIRLVTAISALSNGGYIIEPYVVDRVVGRDGTVIKENETVVRRQVVSRETSEVILHLMEQTVADAGFGTGRNAAVPGFRIGGKTGTSEDIVLYVDTGEKQYIVSFVSAAPIDNPEIVLLVALQAPGPHNTVYVSGGQMAAPVVGAMLQEILPYLGIRPRFGSNEQAVNTQVPYVRRRTVDEAVALLEAEGFEVQKNGSGDRVIDQMPVGGAFVITGSRVILYLDHERSEEDVVVPDVRGMRYEDARLALESRGLHIQRSGSMLNHGNVVVYAQSREPTAIVQRGTVVELMFIDTTQDGFF